jgi:hypothetical protein
VAVRGTVRCHLDHASHGTRNTRKFHEHTVADVLDDPAAVFLDLRIDQFPEIRLQAFVRALLVGPHQPRVAATSAARRRVEATAGHPVAKKSSYVNYSTTCASRRALDELPRSR